LAGISARAGDLDAGIVGHHDRGGRGDEVLLGASVLLETGGQFGQGFEHLLHDNSW
jgi:hypothetical protein